MNERYYKKLENPAVQALVVLTGALVLILIGWFLTVTKVYPAEPLFAWSIATAFMLLFAMLNSLMSLRADSFTRYWGRSMYSYIGLALSSALAAGSFSCIPLREA